VQSRVVFGGLAFCLQLQTLSGDSSLESRPQLDGFFGIWKPGRPDRERRPLP
jgi:hypothetical protein